MSNNTNNGSRPDGSIRLGGVTYDIYLREQSTNTNTNVKVNENENGGWGNNENNNNNSTVAPAPAFSGFGSRRRATSGGAKKAKGTRKLSPYMKFAQEARKKIIANEPELKSDIIKVGKRIGEMWRGLSAEEKAKY